MRRCLCAIAAGLGLLVAGAAAAEPCDAGNVVGIWVLAGIEAAEPGVEEFYARAPYEWTRIRADGGYHYVASNRPKADLAQIEAALDASDAGDGVTYAIRWPRPGTILLLRDGQPFQVFDCRIAAADDGVVRAGDMVLTNVEGMPVLRRVQRRVGP